MFFTDQCPEETWEGSKEYCIFHDPSSKKDTELFEQKLKEKLAEKDFNFTGYFFPEVLKFENKEFKQNVDFTEVTFHRNVDFSRAIFQKDADFSVAIFQENAIFTGASFQNANFNGASFQDADFYEASFQDANFNGASFQNANFNGADFEGNADFDKASFQNANFRGASFQNVDFLRAIFQKNANFSEATFQYADFWGANFEGNTDFIGATFQDADFDEATFQDAVFSGAIFYNTGFWGADFEGNTDFSEAIIKENLEFAPESNKTLDFSYARFLSKSYITADLIGAKFHRADLENVVFVDCIWPEKILEEIYMKEENLAFQKLETIYRNLKQNMEHHGDYVRAARFFYREMEMRRKGANTKKRIWLELYRLLAGYGEKPERTALSSVVTIFLFALFYWGLSCLEYPRGNPEFLYGFYHAVYFSFVTFTTLGLGDIHPSNNLGMGLICCEAVIGAFLIALFVVVFVRRMIR